MTSLLRTADIIGGRGVLVRSNKVRMGEREIERERERQRDRETESQRDRETEGQRDRETK